MFLFGARCDPIETLEKSKDYVPLRDKKLLLNKKEIKFLYGKIHTRKGYTIIPISFFWKREWCKVLLGLAKGKSDFDKRKSIKEKEWNRAKERLLKVNSNRNFR